MKINHSIQIQDNKLKHFLNIKSLPKAHILEIISRAEDIHNNNKISKYSNKVVASLFFEPSTRTKSSFAIAANNLGCSVIDFDIENSSVQKGESIFETVDALNLMGVDLCVLRHPESVIRELAECLP